MTKYFNKFKKPCFWLIFGQFSQILQQKFFFQKIQLCHTQLHLGFQYHAKIQKKINIQFQEDAWSEGQTEGWKNGRTNRLYFIGPFQLLPEVQISCVKFKELNTSHLFTFRTMKTTVQLLLQLENTAAAKKALKKPSLGIQTIFINI